MNNYSGVGYSFAGYEIAFGCYAHASQYQWLYHQNGGR
jgi:hypothetical protein